MKYTNDHGTRILQIDEANRRTVDTTDRALDCEHAGQAIRPTSGTPHARAEQLRPSIRKKLRRRVLVERKLAELKMHGLGKARYRGARKVLLQARLTAGLVNVKKLFTLDIPAPEARIT